MPFTLRILLKPCNASLIMHKTAAFILICSIALVACSSLQSGAAIKSAYPPPVYPKKSIKAGEEGKVLVLVSVGETGEAIEVRLLETSGHSALDDSAIMAVRQWKFSPAQKEGRPVHSWLRVPVAFEIQK